MPPEIKTLLGAMNLDDPLESVGKGFHVDARNIEFDGTPPNRRAKIKPGNMAVPNSLLPPTGVNKIICRKYDSITKRIYFFNFNSAGSHGIYLYNTIPGTFQRLVQVGVNTLGDPLAFTAESHTNLDVIYGDGAQGDIMYFLDSLGRPSKVNISTALSGGYGNIKRSFLDVAKEPADMPPVCVYEQDASSTVNNLRKKLFKFKIRWVFDDQDKSITSSQGEMPLPFNAFDQATDSNPTYNSRIAIIYQTGPENVKKIELLGAVSLGNVFSDFFLIASIDKAVDGIGSNLMGTYLFYNDKAYNYINVEESIQLQDYVPQTAGAQTLLNGNVVTYGKIKEGYPNLTNFSFNGNTSGMTAEQDPYYYGETFTRLVAAQDGKGGFGSGNIHIVVRGLVITAFTLDTYTVYMTDGSNITYTLSSGDDAAAVIEGLRVNAISKGYTVLANDGNNLIVVKSGISLARSFITSNYVYNSIANSSFCAYDWLGKHGWALVYYDLKYRTNGAVYTNGFSVSSSPYTEGTPPSDKPTFNASIYHVPPDWAYYYQWVRTKDLKKSKFQQWVSDRTFKDLTTISGQNKYAYISIESLNVWILANPGSPLGYGFSPGDRITFFKRYNEDGSTAYLYYNTKDFEIVASVTNPTINGEVKIGQFVKIILPPTDGAFDFGDGFHNYFIEMYTPAQSVANGLDVYYEYGEMYTIGNPGLSTRFHQGMLQNQSTDHLTPATFEFTKGDFYIRLRSIQTGNVFTWNVPTSANANGFRFLIPLNFIGFTYSDPNITAQSVPLSGVGGVFNPATDSRWMLSVGTNTTFKVGGSVSINFPTARSGDSWRVIARNIYGDTYVLVPPFDASNAGTYSFAITTVEYNGSISQSITLENDRLFILFECINSSSNRLTTFLSSSVTLTIDHVITQRCIDPNFSDYFASAVNSNGRAFIYDQNANQVTFPDMYRWGLAYQTNTNINQTNRFYPQNFDEANRRYGAIQRMAQLGNDLIFFMERKIGHTGVYQKFIADNTGNSQLVTTNSIITQNNIQYYGGEIGVGNQPTSVVQSDFVFYGIDPVKNVIWRLSRDGITDLTELYKVKTWASANLPKYLNPGTYSFGGSQKVLGTFNLRPDNIGEYLLLAQGTSLVRGETFSFEESYNSFASKVDIDCDTIVNAETILYAFRNGVLWKMTTANAYANFFDTQYFASITLCFNDQEPVKKVFNSIAYQSNQTWSAPTKGDVKTNTVSSQTGFQQESSIMFQDFDALENPNRYAAFNRNQNSSTDPVLSLWEGEYLTGNYVVVKLSIGFSGFCYLYSPYINWQRDPRNF